MLAALTFWLEQIAQPPARATAASRDDPDFIVDKLSALMLNKSGVASYTLSAARMVHYPEGDTTLLTTPKFVAYGAAKAPVTITANEAVVSANGQHVYFQDNVRVTRAAHGASSELLERTSGPVSSLPLVVGGTGGRLQIAGAPPLALRPTGALLQLPLSAYHRVRARDGHETVFSRGWLWVEGEGVLRAAGDTMEPDTSRVR